MRLSRRLPALAAFTALLALAAPRAALAATASSDGTFGYEIPADPLTPLTQASAVWNVATATQHTAGEPESAQTFVALGDIAVGTEAAVTAGGTVTYRAWYSGGLASQASVPLTVAAGDDVRGTLERDALVPVLWRLTLDNLTTGTTWTTTAADVVTPQGTARFMVQGQVRYDEFGFAYPEMPDLADTRFDEVTVNGANPALQAGQRVEMGIYEEPEIVATPSLPQADGNGFGACAWATSCAVPPDF